MKKIIALTLLSLSLVISVTLYLYYETHVFAPSRLDIKRILLKDDQIPNSFDGVRVLFFSDLHSFASDPALVEKVFTTIQSLQPDLVLFGGDLIDGSKQQLSLSEEAQLIQWLSSIDAPLGKFAILGDADLRHLNQLSNIYTLANFELLQANVRRIYQFDQSYIELNSTDSFQPSASVVAASSNRFSILLSYDPNVLQQPNSTSYNLILAAKTHGGQVELPVFGPLYAPARQKHYRGTSLEGQPKYIISNGIATLAPAYRWLTNPSLYVIELKKQP